MAGKIEVAMTIGKDLMENSVIRGAVEHAEGAAEKLLHDTMPASVVGTIDKAAALAKDAMSRFLESDQAKWRPVSKLLDEARYGEAVTMRMTDGPSKIVFDEKIKCSKFC